LPLRGDALPPEWWCALGCCDQDFASQCTRHVVQIQWHLVELIERKAGDEGSREVFYSRYAAQMPVVINHRHNTYASLLQDIPHLVQRGILMDGHGRTGHHIGHTGADVGDQHRWRNPEAVQDVLCLRSKYALPGGHGLRVALQP